MKPTDIKHKWASEVNGVDAKAILAACQQLHAMMYDPSVEMPAMFPYAVIAAEGAIATAFAQAEYAAGYCQSPIECLMLWALLAEFYPYGSFGTLTVWHRGVVLIDTRDVTTEQHGLDHIDLTLQAPVGRYFADFVLRATSQKEPLSPIAIECDGHDFHEKTKDQAAHDKTRDRAFVTEDYRLLRFTGSQIHADPMECVSEVRGLLAKLNVAARRARKKRDA